MSLIVEDGTGLSNADSYISLDDARVYADNYGYTLPVDDDEASMYLRKAVAYIDNYASSFSGELVNDEQSLYWGRVNAYKCSGRNQICIPDKTVPNEVKFAQVIAAAEYATGSDVRSSDDGRSVASEQVTGAVAVSYFDNGKTGGSIKITEVSDMLSPLLCYNTMYSARTLRV